MELMKVAVCLLALMLVHAQDGDDLSLLWNQRHLQGDLKLGPDRRNAVNSDRRKWPNGVIPYEIRPEYTDREKRMIETAMRRIEQGSCIKFVPRTSQTDYIYIKNTNDGCYSTSVGYRRGQIEISLQSSTGPNCMHHSVIVHELLHAVGLWHEQMRYDRDQFVKIHYDNVAPGLESQFSVVGQSQSSTYNIPYDYTSVMHYGKTAFSVDKSKITIEPLKPQYLNVIGRAKDISQSDLLKVNKIYNCNRGNDGSTTGTDGETTQPAQQQCQDMSSACSQYLAFCRVWDLLRSYCKRTCNLCS